jgi:hypothetical protein
VHLDAVETLRRADLERLDCGDGILQRRLQPFDAVGRGVGV